MLFWSLALLMLVGALAMLLPSLMGRRRAAEVDRTTLNTTIFNDRRAELEREREAGEIGEEDYRQALHELERDLLRDAGAGGAHTASLGAGSGGGRPAAVVVALLVPVMTVAVYFAIGDRGLATGEPAQAAAPADGRQPSLAEMVDGLAARLESEPRNVEGWTMLGRSYQMLERYDDALKAFARARELAPQDPDLLVLYGESLGLSRGGNLVGEPERFVTRALAIDPNHGNALWLKGLAAEQRGDDAQALASWTRLRDKLGPDEQAMLDQYLMEVQARMGAVEDGAAPVAEATADPAPPATAGAVTVRVRLAEDLAADAEAGDTVFVFARAASGPRMPLAIVRVSVADLPLEVVLDDAMAMTPNFQLSNFDQVVVGARISRSGNAMPQPGDLEGISKPLAWRDAPPVEVVIDSRVKG